MIATSIGVIVVKACAETKRIAELKLAAFTVFLRYLERAGNFSAAPGSPYLS